MIFSGDSDRGHSWYAARSCRNIVPQKNGKVVAADGKAVAAVGKAVAVVGKAVAVVGKAVAVVGNTSAPMILTEQQAVSTGKVSAAADGNTYKHWGSAEMFPTAFPLLF